MKLSCEQTRCGEGLSPSRLLVNYKNMNLYTNPTSRVVQKLQPSQTITLLEAKQIGPSSVPPHLYNSKHIGIL